MSYCVYEADREKKIATITFNKPEKLNSAVTADWNELKQLLNEVEEDDAIKVLIFKGAGRCFGTGHDVADLGPHHGWGGPKDPRPSQRRRLKFDKHVFWGKDGVGQRVLYFDKATIAQVHGYCYGGHHEIAVACDLTIAAEDAAFTHPGYRYIGPLGEIVLFMHTIGVKKTKELMLTGTPLDAMTALQYGLVNKVAPIEKLEEETMKIAETIAQQPADAIFMGKSFLELALDIMGVGAGYTAGYVTHTLQTNIHYEPDEFNLFKEKAKKGVKGAITERETAYKGAPLVQPK